MNPFSFAALSAEPFRLWSALMWKSGEMMYASAQVIGYRVNPALWMGDPFSARNTREFALMGTEKFEAATESLQAAALNWAQLNQQIGTSVYRQALHGWSAMASVAASRTAGQAATRQRRLAKDVVKHSVAEGARLAGATARGAQRVLKPVRSRAVANARRLAKR